MASWGGLAICVGWYTEWVDTLSGRHPKWVGSPGVMATQVQWHFKAEGTSRVGWHPGWDDIPSWDSTPGGWHPGWNGVPGGFAWHPQWMASSYDIICGMSPRLGWHHRWDDTPGGLTSQVG